MPELRQNYFTKEGSSLPPSAPSGLKNWRANAPPRFCLRMWKLVPSVRATKTKLRPR
jgi:hypothetical protein